MKVLATHLLGWSRFDGTLEGVHPTAVLAEVAGRHGFVPGHLALVDPPEMLKVTIDEAIKKQRSNLLKHSDGRLVAELCLSPGLAGKEQCPHPW